MIADVAFDAPLARPFSYGVPDGWALAAGQRVVAPLRGARRVGMVVALREGADPALKPLLRHADGAPVLGAPQLDLVRWIAAESLSSIGSTCAALLPPPIPDLAIARSEAPRGRAPKPELLTGAGRERRVLERLGETPGTALVIVPDNDASARWGQRLAKLGRTVRLDSGVDDDARAAAWRALGDGGARFAVGTRSALLAPLAPPAVLVLVDEHEAAHKPPGHPRIHAREVVVERGAREGATCLLTSATPSVETWWRADSGRIALAAGAPGPWPRIGVADTRGILRREPITPPLARAIRETLAAGRRVFLAVGRLTSALACDECGTVMRCEECRLAFAYSRASATLACRLCGRSRPLPDTCATCGGRRLSPFGWSAERVEHAVRRRFGDARIARYDPESARGVRGEARRAAATAADVVVGTRGALRLFGPASLGLAGFVAPDQLLRVPDFRAGERAFAFVWAAAERVAADGQVIVQSQNPGHYAFEAVARQDLAAFYRHDLKFRAELGYPPFRRLALVSVRAGTADAARALAGRVAGALGEVPELTVYPPAPDRRERTHRIVVKGRADLPHQLGAALVAFPSAGTASRGIIDVEVDPVEWPF